MDLDELKKSWNQVSEQLKDKELIKDENICKLKEYVSSGVNDMRGSRVRNRIYALIILIPAVIAIIFINTTEQAWTGDLFLLIGLLAAIPAFIWDIYCTNYLTKTKIDEQPLKEVIIRFNNYHRWISIETILGFAFFVGMVIYHFIINTIWEKGPLIIAIYFIIWTIAIYFPIRISKREFKRLRRVRKNLAEIKELED